MRQLDLTSAILTPILERDPAGPRITHYDDATGARIELSAITLANWAAKTANFVCDEFGLDPGARASVLLPPHWQTAGVLFGVWWAGLELVDDDADIAFVTSENLDIDAPEVVALSLDAFGRPLADLPVGVTDYATSVRIHGDRFSPRGGSVALLDAARESASVQGISSTDRVLSDKPWDGAGLVDNFLAVYAAGASLVQVSNSADLSRHAAPERVTRTL